MTAGMDSLVSIAWNRRPREDYLLGMLTEMEVACVTCGWQIIEALLLLPRERVPEEVRDGLEALEWVEEVYALRQSELRQDDTKAPASRQAS